MSDWLDEIFNTQESFDETPRLRDYCFNLWDSIDFPEKMEAHDYWTRIETGKEDDLKEILRQLIDRLPDKVREGRATQKEIAEFINDRL